MTIVFSHDVTAAILVSQNKETAAMLVSQTNPVGVELLSYVNTFFCSNKLAWLLATWVKTLFTLITRSKTHFVLHVSDTNCLQDMVTNSKLLSFCQILLCVIAFITTTRLSGAKPRGKLRGNGNGMRLYKLTTRGNCDPHAPPTHRRMAHLWSKLGFHLAVLSNGTLHGVNNTYCKQTRRCK